MLDDWPIRALRRDVAPLDQSLRQARAVQPQGLALTQRRSLLEDCVISSELVAVDIY
jgi:hypothetical protein